MPFRADRVRVAILVTKNSDITQEEFSHYWLEKHSKVFISLAIVQRNILKYEQAHINVATLETLKDLGINAPQFDGIASFEAESYEKIFEVFTDEEYIKIAMPDELKFVDRSKFKMMPLDLATILDRNE